MRRIAVLVLLVGLPLLPAATHSTAAPATPTIVTTLNGYCFASPFNQLVPCPPTATPQRPLVPIDKLVQVGSGIVSPAGTTSYVVNITSKHACFSLAEPIAVYALGHAGSAVLSPIEPPPPEGATSGSSVVTTADPDTGLATLLLEVLNRAVGPEGVTLKAVWTQEQIERLAQVSAAAPSTGTPVPSPTATQVATTTPAPTATATPGTFTVRACVDPNLIRGRSLGGDFATLYGATLPGAVCTASISYYKRVGTSPVLTTPGIGGTITPTVTPGTADYSFYAVPQPTEAFTPGPQTALSDGLVVYPWSPNTLGDVGIATVTCTFDNQAPITACTGFLIAQDYDQDRTANLFNLTAKDRVAQIRQLQTRLCPAGTVQS